jgi:alkylation response protein AidB-like acyl-CoA dehydrogenase
MNFVFTAEQEELRSAARGFLADHSSSEQVRQAMESELGYDPQVWKQIAAELGWAAVTIPEAYGGLDLTAVELTALLEVMGASLLCAPYFSSVCLGANALLVAGTEAQKQEYLPQIAEGELTATLACTGPNGRPGVGGVEATWRRDGDAFVLAGAAGFVLDGHSAGLVIVAARAERSLGDAGLALFALPGDAAGLTRRVLPTMDQTRRLAALELANVSLPAAAALGEPGDAGTVLQEILDRAGIALAAEQVGGAQQCLDMAVAYAKEREQFGRPIGSFQAIKHKCADRMVDVESARSAAYYAACVAAGSTDELPSVASLAQAWCSDTYFQTAADSIQIHGGVGFTWEYDCHLHLKRARSSEVFLGDASFHRERVAQLIGL